MIFRSCDVHFIIQYLFRIDSNVAFKLECFIALWWYFIIIVDTWEFFGSNTGWRRSNGIIAFFSLPPTLNSSPSTKGHNDLSLLEPLSGFSAFKSFNSWVNSCFGQIVKSRFWLHRPHSHRDFLFCMSVCFAGIQKTFAAMRHFSSACSNQNGILWKSQCRFDERLM